MKKIAIITLILAVAGLLAAQWIWVPRQQETNRRQRSERINLALRQTAHLLLSNAGNDTAAIEPVRQKTANEFSLKIENGFDYDTLPQVLEDALKSLGVAGSYFVSIKNCETDTLILGYHVASLANKEVACRGREQERGCSTINVTFDEKEAAGTGGLWTGGLAGLLVVIIVAQLFFQLKDKTAEHPATVLEQGDVIVIGSTALHYKNQFVVQDGTKKDLTFRENKLLHHFAKHPDQVLKREDILAAVWGDEGLIVGRSLDVFVSRLRKVLEGDGAVAIKNVHGVGYRLEVKK